MRNCICSLRAFVRAAADVTRLGGREVAEVESRNPVLIDRSRAFDHRKAHGKSLKLDYYSRGALLPASTVGREYSDPPHKKLATGTQSNLTAGDFLL